MTFISLDVWFKTKMSVRRKIGRATNPIAPDGIELFLCLSDELGLHCIIQDSGTNPVRNDKKTLEEKHQVGIK